jgi:hypothetical protein
MASLHSSTDLLLGAALCRSHLLLQLLYAPGGLLVRLERATLVLERQLGEIYGG